MNPATDLLKGLLSKLNSNKVCVGIIKSAKIDLSFFGFGVAIEGMSPITDEETAIIAILEKMKKNEKNLTFLYRAPKIQLKPLNNRVITKQSLMNMNSI